MGFSPGVVCRWVVVALHSMSGSGQGFSTSARAYSSRSMAEIGSVAWLERTRGRLTRREQLELTALGVRSQAVLRARRLGRSGVRVGRLDPRDVRIPDSAAAREAEEVCGGLPRSGASHAHRCYPWGAILAAQDGITFDEELLYVAALLHDAGMPVAAAEGTTAASRSTACSPCARYTRRSSHRRAGAPRRRRSPCI